MKNIQIILTIKDNISSEIIKSLKTLQNISRASKDQQKKTDRQIKQFHKSLFSISPKKDQL